MSEFKSRECERGRSRYLARVDEIATIGDHRASIELAEIATSSVHDILEFIAGEGEVCVVICSISRSLFPVSFTAARPVLRLPLLAALRQVMTSRTLGPHWNPTISNRQIGKSVIVDREPNNRITGYRVLVLFLTFDVDRVPRYRVEGRSSYPTSARRNAARCTRR